VLAEFERLRSALAELLELFRLALLVLLEVLLLGVLTDCRAALEEEVLGIRRCASASSPTKTSAAAKRKGQLSGRDGVSMKYRVW